MEFVVVAAAFIAIVVGVAAMASRISEGIVVDKATQCAPNCVDSEAFGYVLMY